MKIYVAAHFYDWELVRFWYTMLTDAGHEITYPWALIDGGRETPESELTDDVLRAAGERDLKGVEDCQLLLFLAHNPAMLGAPWEAGAAHHAGKRVVVVDPYRTCPFFLLDEVQVLSHAEAVQLLTGAIDQDRPHLF